jgi:hypothetical protein
MGRIRKDKTKTFLALDAKTDKQLFAFCKQREISVRKFTRDAIREKLQREDK